MTTHIFVLLLNCSAIIFFFFWRPLLHLTFLPYLAGKPFFPLSPSPALKFWLLFISLICARKGSRGLVIMDTDFRGVSFHAIKILPLPPPRKCIKKKRGKSEWESRRESSPTERVLFLKPGWAPQWAMKRWIEWLSCLVIRKRGELGFLCGVGVACAGPSLTLLKERGVGWGVGGCAEGPRALRKGKDPWDNEGPWKRQQITRGPKCSKTLACSGPTTREPNWVGGKKNITSDRNL